jgi:hypothetical protein
MDDVIAATRAYVSAIAGGAKPHIAFDLACAAYRMHHPSVTNDKLQAAVAHALAKEMKHLGKVLD